MGFSLYYYKIRFSSLFSLALDTHSLIHSQFIIIIITEQQQEIFFRFYFSNFNVSAINTLTMLNVQLVLLLFFTVFFLLWLLSAFLFLPVERWHSLFVNFCSFPHLFDRYIFNHSFILVWIRRASAKLSKNLTNFFFFFFFFFSEWCLVFNVQLFSCFVI